jgi:hypothetical protein
MLPFSDSSHVCKSETRNCAASLRRDVSRDSRVVNRKKQSVSVSTMRVHGCSFSEEIRVGLQVLRRSKLDQFSFRRVAAKEGLCVFTLIFAGSACFARVIRSLGLASTSHEECLSRRHNAERKGLIVDASGRFMPRMPIKERSRITLAAAQRRGVRRNEILINVRTTRFGSTLRCAAAPLRESCPVLSRLFGPQRGRATPPHC